jgi:hypothetical protein
MKLVVSTFTFAAVLVVTFACSGAFASEPGQRLTWDDIGLRLPRLAAESFLAPLEPTACLTLPMPNVLQCAKGFPDSQLDGDGNLYFSTGANDGRDVWRTRPDGVTELVVEAPAKRTGPYGTTDLAQLTGFYVDLVNGFLYLRLSTGCSPAESCGYSSAHEIIRVRGLGRLRGAGQTR